MFQLGLGAVVLLALMKQVLSADLELQICSLFLLFYAVCKRDSWHRAHCEFCPFPFLQHHHDHLLHTSGSSLDAPVPVDLQPGLDQHLSGAVTTPGGGDPDSLQHSHPYRLGGLHSVQIQPGGGLHCEGKVTPG